MESGRLRSYKDMNISNSIGMPGKIWKVFGDASWFSSNKAPFCSKSKYVCSQYEHMRLSKHGSYIYFPQIHHFIKKTGKHMIKWKYAPFSDSPTWYWGIFSYQRQNDAAHSENTCSEEIWFSISKSPSHYFSFNGGGHKMAAFFSSVFSDMVFCNIFRSASVQ